MQRCESTPVFEIRAKNIVFTEKEIPSEFAHTLASRIWFVRQTVRLDVVVFKF